MKNTKSLVLTTIGLLSLLILCFLGVSGIKLIIFGLIIGFLVGAAEID